MTDDISRARAHLAEAERIGPGDAAGHALIALGLLAADVADRLKALTAFLEPEGERPNVSAADIRTARERHDVEMADREARRAAERRIRQDVDLSGGRVVSPGEPGTPGYDPKDDPSVVEGRTGVFGQMEVLPNALEDAEQH